jgi:hypothetical protein
MRKQKKTFYITGIISLIFIAPVFWYLAQPTLKKMNLRVMDIGLPYKAKKGEKIPEYAQIPFEGWNYKPIKIPANFNENTEKQFIGLISKLQNEKIEKNGLKFQFSKENSYGDIVKMLNIMIKTKQEFYGIDMEKTNSMYVLYFKPIKNDEYVFDCDQTILYLNQRDYESQHSTLWQKLIYFSPKESYYLIFSFLILIYSAMLKPKLTL